RSAASSSCWTTRTSSRSSSPGTCACGSTSAAPRRPVRSCGASARTRPRTGPPRRGCGGRTWPGRRWPWAASSCATRSCAKTRPWTSCGGSWTRTRRARAPQARRWRATSPAAPPRSWRGGPSRSRTTCAGGARTCCSIGCWPGWGTAPRPSCWRRCSARRGPRPRRLPRPWARPAPGRLLGRRRGPPPASRSRGGRAGGEGLPRRHLRRRGLPRRARGARRRGRSRRARARRARRRRRGDCLPGRRRHPVQRRGPPPRA
ncbi:unnamed protein product, partial [Prorocentrum cordatum]